ncbi:phosphohydrolase [gut metagenome]|uniref:Phosphohydrolase n=1 Tax=gut metagenome TaxID=749906 RepID=J9H2Y6_9ZZZZ
MAPLPPQPSVLLDTLWQADTVGLPSNLQGLLVLDHSELRHLHPRPVVRRKKPVHKSIQPPVVKEAVIRLSKRDLSSKYDGIDRIRQYDVTHADVPAAFEGCRLAFISDLHYKSLFKEKELKNLVRLLNELHPDALLIGGDMHEGCQYVAPLMEALAQVKTPLGSYAALGNNDYESCYEDVVREMQRQGIQVLEHKVASLKRKGARIQVAGVRNPFDLTANGKSPTLKLADNDFVILLVHTPDYAEDVPVTHTDLVLAGHTHGGQVTLFGYAPIVPSRYGQRFLTGLKYTSQHVPMIITNGIGTSQKPIRLGAPSEVVLITLHRP